MNARIWKAAVLPEKPLLCPRSSTLSLLSCFVIACVPRFGFRLRVRDNGMFCGMPRLYRHLHINLARLDCPFGKVAYQKKRSAVVRYRARDDETRVPL